MPKIIIPYTRCLIILEKIKFLEILNYLYDKIITTPEVSKEFGNDLPPWINIEKAKDLKYQKLLETQIDKGEASVIALALEKEGILLILDDLHARKIAKQLNLNFTGTLGLIYKAKQTGFISELRPLIEKLKEPDFWIADKVVDEILKLSGE
jgi:predicted nucleic acid-binding protein